MGLLDSIVGGVVGQVLGGGRGGAGGMSPIVKALLMLLLAKGASGGLGNVLGEVLGGGHGAPAPHPRSGGAGPYGRDPGHAADDGAGDIGGFNQGGGRTAPAEPLPRGDFSDLSGMLDGPGDAGRSAGAAGYDGSDAGVGGLDGLIDRFRRGGLGDAVESWVGHGPNHAVAPHQVASALGPDALDTLQSQTGLSRDDLLGQLAQVLPEVVHTLTPQGRMPDEHERRGW